MVHRLIALFIDEIGMKAALYIVVHSRHTAINNLRNRQYSFELATKRLLSALFSILVKRRRHDFFEARIVALIDCIK